MKGKDFEKLCVYRMEREERDGRATMSKYGVQVSLIPNDKGVIEPKPIRSLPDFEGTIAPDGHQFITEAKVCSQSKLDLLDSKVKQRQLDHLMRRADFGVTAFILIHWPERKLKTRIDPVATFAMPVHRLLPFWLAAERKEVKAIRRDDCELYGVSVEWNVIPGCRTPSPDLLPAILEVRTILAELRPSPTF